MSKKSKDVVVMVTVGCVLRYILLSLFFPPFISWFCFVVLSCDLLLLKISKTWIPFWVEFKIEFNGKKAKLTQTMTYCRVKVGHFVRSVKFDTMNPKRISWLKWDLWGLESFPISWLHKQWWRGFKGGGGSWGSGQTPGTAVAPDGWAFLSPPPPPPHPPLLSPLLGDEQAHYHGSLIKGGHYLLSVHFELRQRNPLPLVSGLCLRNAAVRQVARCQCSSPQHHRIRCILARQRTKSISTSIFTRHLSAEVDGVQAAASHTVKGIWF